MHQNNHKHTHAYILIHTHTYTQRGKMYKIHSHIHHNTDSLSWLDRGIETYFAINKLIIITQFAGKWSSQNHAMGPKCVSALYKIWTKIIPFNLIMFWFLWQKGQLLFPTSFPFRIKLIKYIYRTTQRDRERDRLCLIIIEIILK